MDQERRAPENAAVECAAAPGADRRGRRRFPVAMLVAALILVLQVFAYMFTGVGSLLDLGVLGSRPAADFMALGALTAAGQQLSVTLFVLVFGVGALGILVGLLLRRRWAWTAAMTWAAVSLALGLFNYFRDEPQYLNMLAGVVFMLVLNQSLVQRAFRRGES